MEKIYCISGTAADHRIFNNLAIENYELEYVPWPEIEEHDTFQTYARKISDKITTHNPILLGLSLGGMLAVEIGKIRTTRKIFLVSSARCTAQLTFFARLPGARKLISLVPRPMLETTGFIGNWLVGARNAEERKLLTGMMRDAQPGFIRWVLRSVVSWNNHEYPSNIIQIHGTKDKVIYPFNIKPDFWIKGGSHLMVYNRAKEINRIISDCLRG